jgi:GTP cyclohydrolase II
MTSIAGIGRPVDVQRVVETRLPTTYGEFRAIGYYDPALDHEHMALVQGDVTRPGVLTRLHSECLTGDAFGSVRCECGDQLAAALRAIASARSGVLIYLRGHEGRGIGLLAKLQAMRLQEQGMDTVEANVALGLPVDARDYRVAADILHDLGAASVRLLSNNPRKLESLRRNGIRVVRRVPLLVTPNAENLPYLLTKRERMDHLLPHLDAASESRTSAKDPTRLAKAALPFAADASDGRPTTPDSV